MVKLYTVEEMRELEREADRSGISYDEMMENAGKSLADEIEIAYSHLPNKNIIALIGSGNNGGDALVALSYLDSHGWSSIGYVVKGRPDDDPLVKSFVQNGGRIVSMDEDQKFEKLAELIDHSTILVDGIFGTGIKLPMRGDVAKVLKFCKNKVAEKRDSIHVVAVDCPSGVDCETGAVAEETIPAELTITMAGIKSGLINTPASHYLGKLRIGNIGNLDILTTYNNNNKIVLDKEIVSKILPARPLDAHKGTFGTALIIAGSVNYTGAALLSGWAAYRSGAGLVTLAIPEILHTALAGRFPEATWLLLPHEMGVISQDAAKVVRQNVSRATAMLIGPGFGLEDTTKNFIAHLLLPYDEPSQSEMGFLNRANQNQGKQQLDKPLVFDADGLKLLAKTQNWYKLIPQNSVLTPHPGEMSILSGLTTDQIQTNRVNIALEYAAQWGQVVVLKGAYTLIAAPDGRLAVVPIATPALARAGTGDVLAGLVVGFLAQGVSSFEAACASAWIHANAGIKAAERLGNSASVIAGDVLEAVPPVISSLAIKN